MILLQAGVIYLYMNEIFKTKERALGVGVVVIIGRFGGILAPFISALLINKNIYPKNKEDLKAEEDDQGSALGSIGLKPKIVH